MVLPKIECLEILKTIYIFCQKKIECESEKTSKTNTDEEYVKQH